MDLGDILFFIAILVILLIIYDWAKRWKKPKSTMPRKRQARVVQVRARNPVINIALEQFANVLDYEVQRLNDNIPQVEIREEVRPIYADIFQNLVNNEIEPDEWEVWEGVTDLIQHANWFILADDAGINFANHATQASAGERMETARQDTDVPAKAAEKYFDTSIRHTTDTQNVHESKIVKGAADIYQRLISDGDLHPISEIEHYIAQLSDREKANAATRTLTTIVGSGQRVSAIGADEITILQNVWTRTFHPSNIKNAANMREAVINALADGLENGNVVCVSGRVTRLLYAFTDLDSDRSIAHSTPMSYEAYKNQVFTETSAILRKLIDDAKNSDDPLVRSVGEAYDGRGEAPPEQEEQFKTNFRNQVRDNLEKYNDKLSDNEKNTLMTECCAVIDM